MNFTALTRMSPSFPSRRASSVTARNGASWPLIAMLCLALGGIVRAGATAYEPFNYATGSLANGTATTGAGFTGNWTCGAAGTIIPGLTYPGLAVDNNALSSGSGRQFVSLSTPLATGAKWISFLFGTSPGNPGANKNGVYFPNGGTGLWFGFGLNPYSSTQGQLGIGSMNTAGTAALGATSLLQLGLGTYGKTYLVVLHIEFNTSGNNDTITVYLNPVANQAAPGVPAAGTYGGFDVGTITGVGLNVQGAGNVIVDEIRVGDTYGDVVGHVATPPSAPTGLIATPGANVVNLSWTAAAGSPTSYNVKRSSVSGGPYANIGAATAPTVSYNDSVLGGETYYYVVTAQNGAGESLNSLEVSATPTLAAPAAPAGLAATPGDAQVALSWSASAFATTYSVKRSTAFAGPYTFIDSTSAPTVSYVDASGLSNGTTYYYVVSATGAGGTSSDTSPVSATPISSRTILTIARGKGITWFGSNGVTYQVQWSSAEFGTNTVWNNLGGPIVGKGATNTVFDPAGSPHNFYQVLSIQ
jgi:fibronectin type 3 domain-containing protein